MPGVRRRRLVAGLLLGFFELTEPFFVALLHQRVDVVAGQQLCQTSRQLGGQDTSLAEPPHPVAREIPAQVPEPDPKGPPVAGQTASRPSLRHGAH